MEIEKGSGPGKVSRKVIHEGFFGQLVFQHVE